MDYATNFPARADMIWKAISSYHVKDPTAYRVKMQKKYGPLLMEAVSLAYEPLQTECLAVVEKKIDEALSTKFGWTTRDEWRMS